jgi:hypothetical protein
VHGHIDPAPFAVFRVSDPPAPDAAPDFNLSLAKVDVLPLGSFDLTQPQPGPEHA